MQTPSFNPAMPPQMQAEQGVKAPAPAVPEEDGSQDIIKGLEEHLNSIADEQKQFLADALKNNPDVTINVLGIVNGPEVYEYFKNLYTTHFANSAEQPQEQPQGTPQAQPSQGQPTQAPSFSPQAKATPTTPFGQ